MRSQTQLHQSSFWDSLGRMIENIKLKQYKKTKQREMFFYEDVLQRIYKSLTHVFPYGIPMFSWGIGEGCIGSKWVNSQLVIKPCSYSYQIRDLERDSQDILKFLTILRLVTLTKRILIKKKRCIDQCFHHTKTGLLICSTNQLIGFHMMETLIFVWKKPWWLMNELRAIR